LFQKVKAKAQFKLGTTMKPHNSIVGKASGGSALVPTQELINKQIIV